jgi:transposase
MISYIAPNRADVTGGVDISKDTLDVYLAPSGVHRQFANDVKGRGKLIAWLKIERPTRIIFEPSGAYHRALERALAEANLPGVKINPLRARRFSEATGKRIKTDQVDAAMLAQFGAVLQPDILPFKHAVSDTLAEVLAARRALVKDRTAAMNHSKNLTLTLLKRQNKQHLEQIASQIDAIDQECKTVLAGNAVLSARLDILLSIPGLGAVTALALLIDMPELGSMDAKQAASLAGLAPITRQSGHWRGKSRIQGGRPQVRQALYMPALVAIRFNAPLKAVYTALRKAGKPAKVAIVAVMRKLLITANALLRDRHRWMPEPMLAIQAPNGG